MAKIQMKQWKKWSLYMNNGRSSFVSEDYIQPKNVKILLLCEFLLFFLHYLNDLKSSTNSMKLIVLSEIMRFWKPLKQPLPRPCHDLLLHALRSRKKMINVSIWMKLSDSAGRVIPWLCFHCSWEVWRGLWVGSSHAGWGGGRGRGG